MKAPSPDGLRMIYGYCLLTILGFLAARIARVKDGDDKDKPEPPKEETT